MQTRQEKKGRIGEYWRYVVYVCMSSSETTGRNRTLVQRTWESLIVGTLGFRDGTKDSDSI